MPDFDETENEIRFTVRDSDDFTEFKTKNMPGGISLVLGKLKGSDEFKVQAVAFDKEEFTVGQATKWLDDHKEIGESFTSTVKAFGESQMIYESIAPLMNPSRQEMFDSQGRLRTKEGRIVVAENVEVHFRTKIIQENVE